MLPARRPIRGLLAVFSVSAVALLSATACGGDPRSVAGFCKLLRKDGAALTDTSDPAGLAERYRALEANVPLQIKDPWHEVTLLLEHVTTFNPKDEADLQAVLAESLRAKSSMEALAAWADTKCKVPLGRIPVADTIDPESSDVDSVDSVTNDTVPNDTATSDTGVDDTMVDDTMVP